MVRLRSCFRFQTLFLSATFFLFAKFVFAEEAKKDPRQNDLFATIPLLGSYSGDELCKNRRPPNAVTVDYNKLPAFLVSKNKTFLQTDTEDFKKFNKIMVLLTGGWAVPGISLGQEPNFTYVPDIELGLGFFRMVADPQKPGQSKYEIMSRSADWQKETYRQVKDILTFACVENFDLFSKTQEKLHFTVQINGVRPKTDEEENELRYEFRALQAGGKVANFVLDEFNRLVWKHPNFAEGIASLTFYIVSSGYRYRLPEEGSWDDIYASRIIRQARFMLTDAGKGVDKPLLIDENRGPRILYEPSVPTPEFFRPGIMATTVRNSIVGANGKNHFTEILEYIRTADPELAGRLDKEISLTKVIFLTGKESLENAEPDSLTAVARHIGYHTIEIAEVPWKRAAVGDPEKRFQAYSLLLGLLEGIRSTDDKTERIGKADRLARQFIKLFAYGKPAKEKVQPMLVDFVTSQKTERWREVAKHYAIFKKSEMEYLEAVKDYDAHVFRAIDNIGSLIEDQQYLSLANDYSTVLGKPMSYTLPKVAQQFSAHRILFWNSFNKVTLPFLDPAEYEKKEAALAVALDLIFNKNVTAEQFKRSDLRFN